MSRTQGRLSPDGMLACFPFVDPYERRVTACHMRSNTTGSDPPQRLEGTPFTEPER